MGKSIGYRMSRYSIPRRSKHQSYMDIVATLPDFSMIVKNIEKMRTSKALGGKDLHFGEVDLKKKEIFQEYEEKKENLNQELDGRYKIKENRSEDMVRQIRPKRKYRKKLNKISKDVEVQRKIKVKRIIPDRKLTQKRVIVPRVSQRINKTILVKEKPQSFTNPQLTQKRNRFQQSLNKLSINKKGSKSPAPKDIPSSTQSSNISYDFIPSNIIDHHSSTTISILLTSLQWSTIQSSNFFLVQIFMAGAVGQSGFTSNQGFVCQRKRISAQESK